MSRPNAYHQRSSEGDLHYVPVRFYPDTAEDPVWEGSKEYIASVVHSATGKFTITLAFLPHDIRAVLCSLSAVGDSTDAYAQGGVETSNQSVVVKIKTGTSNTNLAADADTHVDVLLVLKMSRTA